jgi:ubiquitin-activating enzyme E1 C
VKFLHGTKEYELDMDRKILDEDDGPVKLDTDNMDHMQWLYERSMERAKEFNIGGVTFNLTMQVVKNIVSAIAAPNALISAACVNEALKVITWCSKSLDNYFMYMGHTGVYANTYRHDRLLECVVCGSIPLKQSIDPNAPLQDLLNMLMDDTKL